MFFSPIIATLICILFSPYLTEASSIVDINDLPKYSVKFVHNSINDLYAENQPIIPITIKGHRYMCRMPEFSSDEENQETESKEKTIHEKIKNERTLNNTLAKLDEGCIYFAQGWWMYEYCHNRHVRQYHPEKEGEPITSFFLGFAKEELERQREHIKEEQRYKQSISKDGSSRHTASKPKKKAGRIDLASLKEQHKNDFSEKENEETSDNKEYKDTSNINGKYKIISREHGVVKPYVSFEFDHGTKCDMTGRHRTVEVRVMCGRSPTGHPGPAFVGIEEPSTCNYVAEISYPALCSHPYFEREKENINDIYCFESLSDKPTV